MTGQRTSSTPRPQPASPTTSSHTSAVCADFDGDGDIDVATLDNRGPLRVYRNTLGGSSHHVSLRLEGVDANTSALGARIRVQAGERVQVDEARLDNTFLSQQPFVRHFGLGQYRGSVRVDVRWPDGVESTHALAVDREHLLRHPSL